MALSLFLASQSPRRAELLTQWGYDFTVIPNRLDVEDSPQFGTLRAIKKNLITLSEKKVLASRLDKGITLSADTVVVYKRNVLGKPSHLKEAETMLSCLSGSTHRVLSSVSLYHSFYKKTWSFVQSAVVTFKPLSPQDIHLYCTQFQVLDKAGSYGIQDIGSTFVESVSGSLTTVIGLPEYPLKTLLAYWGITPIQKG